MTFMTESRSEGALGGFRSGVVDRELLDRTTHAGQQTKPNQTNTEEKKPHSTRQSHAMLLWLMLLFFGLLC